MGLHMSEPFNDQNAKPSRRVGYKSPPKHSQFVKGQSGNPKGRPKTPVCISIKDILDGDQLGKNGEVVTKREAIVIRLLNDALAGNQKAFGRFMKLLKLSGLMRLESSSMIKNFYYDARPRTPEEYEEIRRNFGRPRNEHT
jgi:hypothetical protein